MPDTSRATVLVVEDDPVMRAFLQHTLGAHFAVTLEEAGDTALAALQSGTPADLVVADLRMPGLDGFAFTEAVRQTPGHARLPILILSSSDRSEDRIRALRLGADDFVVKPFNPEELVARLDNLLRRLGAMG